jgi:hypothetical protein
MKCDSDFPVGSTWQVRVSGESLVLAKTKEAEERLPHSGTGKESASPRREAVQSGFPRAQDGANSGIEEFFDGFGNTPGNPSHGTERHVVFRIVRFCAVHQIGEATFLVDAHNFKQANAPFQPDQFANPWNPSM